MMLMMVVVELVVVVVAMTMMINSGCNADGNYDHKIIMIMRMMT